MKKNPMSIIIVTIAFIITDVVINDAWAKPPREPVIVKFIDSEIPIEDFTYLTRAIEPRFSQIKIEPKSEEITGFEIRRELFSDDGQIFEIAHGDPVTWDKRSKEIYMEADLAEDIPDGYYAESVDIDVSLAGYNRPYKINKVRYFFIADGLFFPITIKEYTEAVTTYDIAPDPNGVLRKEARGTSLPDEKYWVKAAKCKKSPESCLIQLEKESK